MNYFRIQTVSSLLVTSLSVVTAIHKFGYIAERCNQHDKLIIPSPLHLLRPR